MLRRLMPLDELEAALARGRHRPRGRFVPVDAVLQGGDYFDPRGPLRRRVAGRAIRSGRWSSEAELAAMQRTLRELERRGQLAAYLAEHDARRREIGQITLLYGSKG